MSTKEQFNEQISNFFNSIKEQNGTIYTALLIALTIMFLYDLSLTRLTMYAILVFVINFIIRPKANKIK